VKRFITAAAVALGAVLLSGSTALASIPDSGGVIHGCYKPQSDGHSSPLGVIDTALSNGHCPSGQTQLTWNQTGPQGPAGPQGPQGPPGPAGGAAQIITQDVHFAGGCGNNCPEQDTETVDCPAGTLAVNGGVLKITADDAWVAAEASLPPGFVAGDGRAIQSFVSENDGAFNPDPVNYSLPRPANDGAAWKSVASLVFPRIQDNNTEAVTFYGMTVTFYAVCI
jgi:hypothetical protein